MRVLIVYPGWIPLKEHSVNLGLYDHGFRGLGSDVVTVCRPGLETGVTYPIALVGSEPSWTDPNFWRSFRAKVALILTWHGMTSIIEAVHAAGVRVIALGDSDGQLSPWFHAWSRFQQSVYCHPTWRLRLGATKLWALRLLFEVGSEHQALVRNTAACDVVTLPGENPTHNFRRLLGRLGAASLVDKVAWLPYPVPESFCATQVAVNRPDRVIAIGRWDSPQKNPRLLASTARWLAAAGSRTELIIVGSGANRFNTIARSNRGMRVVGLQSRDRVRELMAECRAVLITSRWEGAPIVANEMLALGGTVIGTPIPSLVGITAGERFGRVARSHAAADVAAAVHAETLAWSAGKRDPVSIAACWREYVRPDQVARRALALLERPYCNWVPCDTGRHPDGS